MPDYLLASEWKKTLKSHPEVKGADDLTKTLEQYARSKDSPDKELVALKAVSAEAKQLKGKNSKNKDLAGYLDDVLGGAEKAAEKAEKEAKKGQIDDLLVTQLKAAKGADREKPRYFVVALGKPAGVCLAKVPAARKQNQPARSYRKGKGKLLSGLCYAESGKYVFELEDKPVAGLAKLLKKAVKLQSNRDIKVLVRGGGVDLDDETDADDVDDLGEDTEDLDALGDKDEEDDDEEEGLLDDDDEGEDETGTDTNADLTAADFARAAKPLKEALDRLKASDPRLWGTLNPDYVSAFGVAQDKRYGEAVGLLASLRPKVDQALSAGANGSGTGGGDPAPLEARLKNLLQRAVGLGLAPEALKDVKLMASETNLFIRKGQLGEAAGRLDAIEKKLAPRATPSGNGAAVDPKFTARADALAKQLDELAGESGDAVAPLRTMLAEARADAAEGRAVDAEEALDQVEARAKGIARAAAGGPRDRRRRADPDRRLQGRPRGLEPGPPDRPRPVDQVQQRHPLRPPGPGPGRLGGHRGGGQGPRLEPRRLRRLARQRDPGGRDGRRRPGGHPRQPPGGRQADQRLPDRAGHEPALRGHGQRRLRHVQGPRADDPVARPGRRQARCLTPRPPGRGARPPFGPFPARAADAPRPPTTGPDAGAPTR